jgi:hypothetical protein
MALGDGCEYQFCDVQRSESDLPAYTRSRLWRSKILLPPFKFANAHNLPVSIKTMGNCSIQKGSLNIWMAHYPVDTTTPSTDFVDSCGTAYDNSATPMASVEDTTWHDLALGTITLVVTKHIEILISSRFAIKFTSSMVLVLVLNCYPRKPCSIGNRTPSICFCP